MKKASTPSFVVTLPLITKGRDAAVMRKRFEAAKRLHNAVLSEGFRRLGAMRQDPLWASLRTEKDKLKKRAGYASLRKQHGFSEYALSAFATGLKNQIWKFHLGAHEPQTLAKRVFKSLDEYSFGMRGKPRFKGRKRPLHSIEGKSPTSAIRFQAETGCLLWAGLAMPAMIQAQGKDKYLDEALARRIKYSRVLWRSINGKTRYFVQLVLEGEAPKTSPSVPGIGGLDIGPSNVASFSGSGASLVKFCPSVDPCARSLRTLQRKADRSVRSTNPHCFDEKGRWIKGRKITTRSAKLMKVRNEIARTERVLSARRAQDHGLLVNQLMAQANTWQIEKLSYKSFQKMFGKSVKNRAPGSFVNLLKRKAESAGGKVVELDTWKLKMSQFDHTTEQYIKKPLSLRWHTLAHGRGRVQRDVYSALLAFCTDGSTHNPSRIEQMLAAQESVLKHAGLWKIESANAAAFAAAPVKTGRADGMLKAECMQLQPRRLGNPA